MVDRQAGPGVLLQAKKGCVLADPSHGHWKHTHTHTHTHKQALTQLYTYYIQGWL